MSGTNLVSNRVILGVFDPLPQVVNVFLLGPVFDTRTDSKALRVVIAILRDMLANDQRIGFVVGVFDENAKAGRRTRIVRIRSASALEEYANDWTCSTRETLARTVAQRMFEEVLCLPRCSG